MRPISCGRLGITLAGVLAFIGVSAKADTFGSGANAFTIDFVNVGNAGNGKDLGAGGGIYSSPLGGVTYSYRMGTYEIPQDAITKATSLGLANVAAGAWSGSQPAANMSWYEAAAFVNWLNTSTGHHIAYDLTFHLRWSQAAWSSAEAWQAGGENIFRHKDAYYFLPNEDEWYKAAFHKNDGASANYWDYATGSNSVPDALDFEGDAVFDAVFYDLDRFIVAPDPSQPNAVNNVGLASPYGTFGQNGNVWEWEESILPFRLIPPEDEDDHRGVSGGFWRTFEFDLRSNAGSEEVPEGSEESIGFRVASIPEPSSALLLLGSGFVWLLKGRCRPGC